MEIIPYYITVLSYLFLFVYMLSVGLETGSGQLISAFRDSKVITKALLINLVLIPLAAWILIRFIDVSPDIKTGLLLLAIAPGGLFALNFARVAHANIYLAVGLLFLLSLISVVVTPILAHLLLGADIDARRFFQLVIMLFPLILVPVLLGQQLAKHISEQSSQKLAKWIGTLSIVIFIVTTLLSSKIKSPAVKSLGKSGILFIVILVIISWVLGWLLGGKETKNKIVMAISASLRNVGVCLPIAINEYSSTNVIIPILAFSGIAIPMNFLFATVAKILHKHKHRDLIKEKETVAPNP